MFENLRFVANGSVFDPLEKTLNSAFKTQSSGTLPDAVEADELNRMNIQLQGCRSIVFTALSALRR
ncbi:conserved hypothetical protein [Roseibium sp. TrichSKD4]|nr:conserved hypothetical protein [Roseibium sp. TrichSKD4]